MGGGQQIVLYKVFSESMKATYMAQITVIYSDCKSQWGKSGNPMHVHTQHCDQHMYRNMYVDQQSCKDLAIVTY